MRLRGVVRVLFPAVAVRPVLREVVDGGQVLVGVLGGLAREFDGGVGVAVRDEDGDFAAGLAVAAGEGVGVVGPGDEPVGGEAGGDVGVAGEAVGLRKGQ